MITDKTTLAELQALREKLDISSLLITLLRGADNVPVVEVMALTSKGVVKYEALTFAEALDGAFTLAAKSDRKVTL